MGSEVRIRDRSKATLVRPRWKSVAGRASLMWGEAQKLTGRDPDFHRRNLQEATEAGNCPEFELGLQLIPEGNEFDSDFDLLDPIKLILEALVPVLRVGKMVLNHNPDNFFVENEQTTFRPGHIIPGTGFSNDPLLQGHLFSYIDTQTSRLSGPSLHEIPINRPTHPYHNFQRGGVHRVDTDTNPTNYEPNSTNGNWPRGTPPTAKRGGFESLTERAGGKKIRQRSPSPGEYYTQSRLFQLSQMPIKQQHIIDGFNFRLSKAVRTWIRRQVADRLAHVDTRLTEAVGVNLGTKLSDDQRNITPPSPANGMEKDLSLSLYADAERDAKDRVIAALLNEHTSTQDLAHLLQALQAQGIRSKLLYSRMGEAIADDDSPLPIAGTSTGSPSLTTDAVVVPGDDLSTLSQGGGACYYLLEAYKHLEPILLTGDVRQLTSVLQVPTQGEEGVIITGALGMPATNTLLALMTVHRVWSRSPKIAATPVW